MFTGLVFKFLCTILLYVFIVPSSVHPFIEYAWENQQIIYCFKDLKCGIYNIKWEQLFCNNFAVIVLHACCYIIYIDDLQVELLNITQ